MTLAIRDAGAGDVPALLAIWNPLIRETTVIFASEEKTEAEVAALIRDRHAAGRAFLVAEGGGGILGFATYEQFRGGDGYRTAMEHSVHLAPAARGQGTGRALMAALEAQARGAGVHTMHAAVDAANTGGIGFHLALGYAEVGRIPEAGRKFGRFLDVAILQKIL